TPPKDAAPQGVDAREQETPTPEAMSQAAAKVLLARLETLTQDPQQDAIYDALPELLGLDIRAWIKLKRQLKERVTALNLIDFEKAWKALQRVANSQEAEARRLCQEVRPLQHLRTRT